MSFKMVGTPALILAFSPEEKGSTLAEGLRRYGLRDSVVQGVKLLGNRGRSLVGNRMVFVRAGSDVLEKGGKWEGGGKGKIALFGKNRTFCVSEKRAFGELCALVRGHDDIYDIVQVGPQGLPRQP